MQMGQRGTRLAATARARLGGWVRRATPHFRLGGSSDRRLLAMVWPGGSWKTTTPGHLEGE
jgi:hypothetical protein